MSRHPSPELALSAFRIVQEAVQNALKHSHATRISVHLSCESRGLVLTVIDDGVGFVVENARQGFGLTSMNERAAAMGGSFTVASSPQCGTTLTVNLPVPPVVSRGLSIGPQLTQRLLNQSHRFTAATLRVCPLFVLPPRRCLHI